MKLNDLRVCFVHLHLWHVDSSESDFVLGHLRHTGRNMPVLIDLKAMKKFRGGGMGKSVNLLQDNYLRRGH